MYFLSPIEPVFERKTRPLVKLSQYPMSIKYFVHNKLGENKNARSTVVA